MAPHFILSGEVLVQGDSAQAKLTEGSAPKTQRFTVQLPTFRCHTNCSCWI